ncbi:hypothetical protein F8388_003749 [Cannabis sativa]|uniref:Uncharacterized protein n=1 Tax=Cannabis sativa TaxID=3483 RepID=A0A7J6I2V7_CANSA|nr:hypothetical protein F8388_003749 [Cannabis sativa]KAF4400950.1 hypothetical protein G4B88_013791 [Cannabis sativa]
MKIDGDIHILIYFFTLSGGNGPEGFPNGTVTFETRPESDLPDPIAPGNPTLCLCVGQFVPERATGRVPKSVECHPRGFHVPLTELHVLLQLVQYGPPAGVNAEMLESQLEIRYGHEEKKLFCQWQNKRTQSGDVRLQCLSGHRHKLTSQRNPNKSFFVFSLENAVVVSVIGSFVGPHCVGQNILGPGFVPGLVREEHGGAAHSENTVTEKHRTVVSKVPIEGNILCTDHNGVSIWVRSK